MLFMKCTIWERKGNFNTRVHSEFKLSPSPHYLWEMELNTAHHIPPNVLKQMYMTSS